jgi:hypothetical protein
VTLSDEHRVLREATGVAIVPAACGASLGFRRHLL